jgi:hypothetical protein
MRIIIKDQRFIVAPESAAEIQLLAEWKGQFAGHVLEVEEGQARGLSLRDLGARAEACAVPLNVWSKSPEESLRLLSNFAPTPFELDRQVYRSVESFWQGLKFEDPAERARVAGLEGPLAKRVGSRKPYGEQVSYQGRRIPVGTWKHWELMERACWAKFTQHSAAQAALLATGERPLMHKLRRDSRDIPGVIMAQIWMNIRGRLRQAEGSQAR